MTQKYRYLFYPQLLNPKTTFPSELVILLTPLIELAVVCLKELNADKEVCEEVAQQSEIAALSMQVNS